MLFSDFLKKLDEKYPFCPHLKALMKNFDCDAKIVRIQGVRTLICMNEFREIIINNEDTVIITVTYTGDECVQTLESLKIYVKGQFDIADEEEIEDDQELDMVSWEFMIAKRGIEMMRWQRDELDKYERM